MPRRCCVPNCRSNYSGEVYTNVFSFPKDESRRTLWVRKIHRADFTPSKSSVVCMKHLEEQFIIREDSVMRSDGSVLVVERQVPKLTADAYPTLYEGQPTYMTEKTAFKRKAPEEQEKEKRIRDEEAYQQYCRSMKILNFDVLKMHILEKLPEDWILLKSCKDDLYVGKIDYSGAPKLFVVLKFDVELQITVWQDTILIQPSKFKWLLGSELKCDLWTKLECLLSHLNGYKKNSTADSKIEYVLVLLKECVIELCGSPIENQISFLCEQLQLLLRASPRYEPEMLLWACTFYFNYPAAYRCVRDSKKIKLPHPIYLKTLFRNLEDLSSGPQTKYLMKKAQDLSAGEKVV